MFRISHRFFSYLLLEREAGEEEGRGRLSSCWLRNSGGGGGIAARSTAKGEGGEIVDTSVDAFCGGKGRGGLDLEKNGL